MTLLQLCALSLLLAAMTWLLKTAGAKMAGALPMLGGVALFAYAIYRYREPIAALHEMASAAGIDESLGSVLRMLAVGCLSAIAADLCRDMGESGLAARIEMCGRAEILLLCLPFLLELFRLAMEVAA